MKALEEDEDMQLCKAHEKIRTLNRELLLQDDTSAQIAALRKKIALSKDRAQGILSMANKRIAYLHDLWKEPSQRELKMIDVKSSSISPRSRPGEEQLRDLGESHDAVLSQAIATLDSIALSNTVSDSKKESARLANELRRFLHQLQQTGTSTSRSGNTSTLPSSMLTTSTVTSVNSTVSSVPPSTKTTTSVSQASSINPTTLNTARALSEPRTPPCSNNINSDHALNTRGMGNEGVPVVAVPLYTAPPPASEITTAKDQQPTPTANSRT